MQGQEKVHVVGPDLRNSALLPFSAPSSHSDFQQPTNVTAGPKPTSILSILTTLKHICYHWQRTVEHPCCPQGSGLALGTTLHWLLSYLGLIQELTQHTCTFYSLSPWSFGNWNLLWYQKVADNIKCIPLSWCRTLLNLQQHKYHKNYKNCKLTTDFLVQWHK